MKISPTMPKNDILAFDIETTGLDASIDLVTVAAIFDGESATSFRFVDISEDDGSLHYTDEGMLQLSAFCEALDNAPYLAAFNGVKFDIPFLATAFKLPTAQCASWVFKCLDIFEICKTVQSRTFGLNMLLSLNGFESKTGSGANAVHQAYSGQFDELEAYCIDDAKLTHSVSTQSSIALPADYTWRKNHPKLLSDAQCTLHLLVSRDPNTGAFSPFEFQLRELRHPERACKSQ
jgi:hypothetical protein